MRKVILFVLITACILSLVGCGQHPQVPPEVDLNKPFNECWPGTITDIFTEGSGEDLREVIKLEIKDHEPMYFTIIEDTEYLRYYSDTAETEEITKEDLYVGAWVEIDCESYHNSGHHPIFTIKVIEPTDNKDKLIYGSTHDPQENNSEHAISGEGQQLAVKADYPAAIMVDKVLYYLSAEIPAEIDESAIIGYTNSYTDEMPARSGETNFNRELNMPYAKVEGGIAVLHNNEWVLCLPE